MVLAREDPQSRRADEAPLKNDGDGAEADAIVELSLVGVLGVGVDASESMFISPVNGEDEEGTGAAAGGAGGVGAVTPAEGVDAVAAAAAAAV